MQRIENPSQFQTTQPNFAGNYSSVLAGSIIHYSKLRVRALLTPLKHYDF